MSIINEALKKAQGAKDPAPALSGQSHFRRHLELEVQRKSKQINWGPIFVLMVLFLITGPLIAPVFSTAFRRPAHWGPPAFASKAPYAVPIETAGLPANTASAENRKAQFGLEEIPLNPGAAQKPLSLPVAAPRLNLTGIVFSQEGSYCLINGKVVRVGEEIGGAKLTQVRPNQAQLWYHGEEITLSIPE